jgi:hypothetical protein
MWLLYPNREHLEDTLRICDVSAISAVELNLPEGGDSLDDVKKRDVI